MGLDRPLRATSCLADNSWPILDRVADALRADGHEVEIIADLDATDADVLFGCGLLTRDLIRAGAPLEVIAAPVFPEETEPVYRSLIVTRDGAGLDLSSAAGATWAVNEYGSWSGWFGLLDHLAADGLGPPDRGRCRVTGGHRESMATVLDGDCDVASIDSSVWHHHRADAVGLSVIATTRDWPAPPITAHVAVVEQLRTAAARVPGLVAAATGHYDEMMAAADRFR